MGQPLLLLFDLHANVVRQIVTELPIEPGECFVDIARPIVFGQAHYLLPIHVETSQINRAFLGQETHG